MGRCDFEVVIKTTTTEICLQFLRHCRIGLVTNKLRSSGEPVGYFLVGYSARWPPIRVVGQFWGGSRGPRGRARARGWGPIRSGSDLGRASSGGGNSPKGNECEES